jgi:hypothetical protein
MSRTAAVRVAGDATADPLSPGGSAYLEHSSRPWASLLLILPALILYELGTRYFTTAALHGGEQQIIAFSKMEQFFSLFGATGRHLPALAVIASLLAWHIARGDGWKVEIGTLIGMAVEGVILTLPLYALGSALGFLLNRYFPLMAAHATTSAGNHTRDMVIMSLGAGVYEEFVFRLALFTLLNILLKDLLKMNAAGTYLLMVLTSAVLFSAYHYLDPGQRFVTRVFAFRVLAGIYFGIIFLLRGFGITAFSHAAYDIIFTIAQAA